MVDLYNELTLKELKQLVKCHGLSVTGDKRKKQNNINALKRAIKYDYSFFEVDEQSVEDFERYPDYSSDITEVRLSTHGQKVNIDESLKKLSRYFVLTNGSSSYIMQLEQILSKLEELFVLLPLTHNFNFSFLNKQTPKTILIETGHDYASFADLVVIHMQPLVNEISYQEGIYDGHYILKLREIVEDINNIIKVIKIYHQQFCEEEDLKENFDELLGKTVGQDLLLFLPDLSTKEIIDFINKAPQRVLTNRIMSHFLNRLFSNRNVFTFYFIKAIDCTLKQNYLNYIFRSYGNLPD